MSLVQVKLETKGQQQMAENCPNLAVTKNIHMVDLMFVPFVTRIGLL